MPFVERDQSGAIKGVYANAQPGYAKEWLSDDHPDVLAYETTALPRFVLKSTIIQRLHDAGKLQAASGILNSDLYARERWYAADKPSIAADNLEVIGLLKAIGADPAVILAG